MVSLRDGLQMLSGTASGFLAVVTYADFVENLWEEPREVPGKQGAWLPCWCSHLLSPNSVAFSETVGVNLAATQGLG
ncbi:hypothetical protein E2320_002319, partial [Naja naja]